MSASTTSMKKVRQLMEKLQATAPTNNFTLAQQICRAVMGLGSVGKSKETEINTLLEKIVWAPTLYAAAHTLGRPVPDWLEKILIDRLTRDGFIIGTLVRGEYTPKGAAQPRSQLQLHHGNIIFVQERRQSGYCPKEGELVVVHLPYGKYLTTRGKTKIYATCFTPAVTLCE